MTPDHPPKKAFKALVFARVKQITGVQLTERDRMTPRMLSVLAALTESHHALEERVTALRRELKHDAATGLPNHLALEEHMRGMIAARRLLPQDEREPTTIAFLDVNYFKSLNTRFQMPQTDEIMKALAAEIQKDIRAMLDSDAQHAGAGQEDRSGRDMLSRSKRGGDEFVAVLPGMTEEATRQRFERILEGVKQKVFLVKTVDHRYFRVTGISLAAGYYELDRELEPPQRYNRFHDAMAKVENRMLAAKLSMKNGDMAAEPVFEAISQTIYDQLSMDKAVIKVNTPGSIRRVR
jgi:diguanylate cyclase (GGDEF)-like protein